MSAPVISQDDLASFHVTHFSGTPTNHFSEHFLGPVEGEDAEEIKDDGLGYYDDGVKRTLTDEQIAIFRHSEIQTLLRDRRHAEEARVDDDSVYTSVLEDGELEDSRLEDSEMGSRELSEESISADLPPLPPPNGPPSKKKKQKNSKKARKAERARQKGFFKQNIKPDLRKRTWDKVDQGLGNLDYDEDNGATPIQNSTSQRRRISYDD